MMDCPKLQGSAEDNRTDEEKLRDCQNCEYFAARYGVYACTYHESVKEEEE